MCGSKDFNIDCPMAVCKECASEIYCKTKNTQEYCKTCIGYQNETCSASGKLNNRG